MSNRCDKCLDTGKIYSNEPDGHYYYCDCAIGNILRKRQDIIEIILAFRKASQEYINALEDIQNGRF